MSVFTNNQLLSSVLRTLVSEISDDKELTTQMRLARTVMNDINDTIESSLLLATVPIGLVDSRMYLEEQPSPVSQPSNTPMDVREITKQRNADDNYGGKFYFSLLSDLDFKTHFGLTRTTVEVIMNKANFYYYHNRPQVGRSSMPFESKFLMFFWMLTTQDTYSGASNRFNCSKSICHRVFFEMCDLMYSAIGQAIIWPEKSEWTQLQLAFESTTGMPGVFGVIGSCHIKFKTNAENSDLYMNSRGYRSIVLQGICTPDMKFIDVYVGLPGSIGCDQILRNSDIYCALATDSSNFLPDNGYIVGNCAFPLENFLLTPYRSVDNLDDYRSNYNAAIGGCLYVLQKAFSMLRERFKHLQSLEMERIDVLPKIISAACVLHNMILMEDDCTLDVELSDKIHYLDATIIDEQSDPLIGTAETKRDEIARTLYENTLFVHV